MTLINIPFSGFYNSLWSDLLDSEVEQFAENEAEKSSDAKWNPETFYPEPLQIDHGFAWEFVNYSAAHAEIARDYVQAFGEWLDDKARDIDPDAPESGLAFSRLDSPREYNFRTDEIDCDIAPDFVAWMYAQQESHGFSDLSETLERRHKSRDGFISFYSARLSEWIEKPVDSWDYHELRSLLESVFASDLSDDYQMELYYTLSDGAHQYFDSHMDWAKYESKVIEDRAEKLAEWLDNDPDAAAAWIGANADAAAPLLAELPSDVDLPELPYRCTLTPDLFEARP